MKYRKRFYRSWCVKEDGLDFYEVKYRESDLLIKTRGNHRSLVLDLLVKLHEDIRSYMTLDKKFLHSLEPYESDFPKPRIVSLMFNASKKMGVGPMASVAGAISRIVGEELSKISDVVMVENGGDIFIRSPFEVIVGIFAGGSPFSGRIGVVIPPTFDGYIGVCASSGTFGHSKSFGVADSAVVVSEDPAIADAGATALGNLVQKDNDIGKLLESFILTHELMGGVVIRGGEMSVFGVELVKIQ
ncbi:MAG: UPF0280 family protein [Thermotogae bacterium]|nr:UPF0280 family protein [Thermotogota bacterium]